MTARTIDALKANMPLGVTGGTTVQDVHDVLDTLAGKSFVSVKEHGAVGDGVNDDTAAIQAAINTGGPVYIPPGTYKVTATLTINLTGTRIIGGGAFGQTRIAPAVPTIDVFSVTAQQVCFEHFEIQPLQMQTAGFGIVFQPLCFNCTVRCVRMNFIHNGILINGSTECRVYEVGFRYLYGVFGVLFTGTAQYRSYRAIIQDLVTDNPYPLDPNAAGAQRGAWQPNTAYSVGHVVDFAGMIWQCTQSGTSGTGGPPNGIRPFFTTHPDGGVRWEFVSNSLSWIVQDNYAYSLVLSQCALIDGVRGFLMTDSAKTGESYPLWMFGHDIESDHQYLNGMTLEAGEGVFTTVCWHGSTFIAHGVHITSTCRGEVSMTGCRIMGCRQTGVRVENGPVDIHISNCVVGDNVGNGLEFAAGTQRFVVTNNRLGDVIGTLGTIQPYGIAVTSGNSNQYIITGNNCRGNATGGIFDGGTGVNKIIANNL